MVPPKKNHPIASSGRYANLQTDAEDDDNEDGQNSHESDSDMMATGNKISSSDSTTGNKTNSSDSSSGRSRKKTRNQRRIEAHAKQRQEEGEKAQHQRHQ